MSHAATPTRPATASDLYVPVVLGIPRPAPLPRFFPLVSDPRVIYVRVVECSGELLSDRRVA